VVLDGGFADVATLTWSVVLTWRLGGIKMKNYVGLIHHSHKEKSWDPYVIPCKSFFLPFYPFSVCFSSSTQA
jgi:hypothetical protein